MGTEEGCFVCNIVEPELSKEEIIISIARWGTKQKGPNIGAFLFCKRLVLKEIYQPPYMHQLRPTHLLYPVLNYRAPFQARHQSLFRESI